MTAMETGKEYAVRIPSRELVDPTGTTKTTCHHHKGVQEYQTIVPDKVTVSAAPRFNIQVLEGSNEQNQLLGTFDFNTGKKVRPIRAKEMYTDGWEPLVLICRLSERVRI